MGGYLVAIERPHRQGFFLLKKILGLDVHYVITPLVCEVQFFFNDDMGSPLETSRSPHQDH